MRTARFFWRSRPERHEVLKPSVAFLVTNVLSEALVRGTGNLVRQAGLKVPAAGKTGTTDEGTDAWFVGYTPEVAASVWIGFDQNRPILEGAAGGRLAAPLWGRVMARAYQNRQKPRPWQRPAEVVSRPIDPATGLVLKKECAGAGAPQELFVEGLIPASYCPGRGNPPRNGFPAQQQQLAEREVREAEQERLAKLTEQERQEEQEKRDQVAAARRKAEEEAERQAVAERKAREEAEKEKRTVLAEKKAREEEAKEKTRLAEEKKQKEESERAKLKERRERIAKAEAAADRREKEIAAKEKELRAKDREGDREDKEETRVAQALEKERRARSDEEEEEAQDRDRRRREAREAERAREEDDEEEEDREERAASSDTDLSGWWEMTNTIQSTNYADFKGLRLGYRVQLEQDGDRIVGRGQKWSENGRTLPASARTPLTVTGTVDGDKVILEFKERGAKRTTGGSFSWTLSPDRTALRGSFQSTAADTSGSSLARRMP